MNDVSSARGAVDEDARLVTAFLAGNEQAFDRLVSRHQGRIFNLCLWMLGNRMDADDAAQETFIKAYRSLTSFRFQSAFSTWLYRIAVNTCKTRHGSPAFRFSRKAARLDSPTGEVADPNPSQEDALGDKETAAAIMAAIAALPGSRRTAVVLRDVEGMSYEEIAAVTGCRVGTVKSRLARGRRQLQKKLKGFL